MIEFITHSLAWLWHGWIYLLKGAEAIPVWFFSLEYPAGVPVPLYVWLISGMIFAYFGTCWAYNNRPWQDPEDFMVPILICILGAVGTPLVLITLPIISAVLLGVVVLLCIFPGPVVAATWWFLTRVERREAAAQREKDRQWHARAEARARDEQQRSTQKATATTPARRRV